MCKKPSIFFIPLKQHLEHDLNILMSKYCHNEISSSFLFLIVYNYVASKGYLPLLVFRENALTEEATYIPV